MTKWGLLASVFAVFMVAGSANATVFYDFENGTQGWSGGKAVACKQSRVGATGGKYSLQISGFNSKFVWIGSTDTKEGSVTALHSASEVFFDVTFAHDVALKKDTRGYTWFTFIASEQDPDHKWLQSSHNAGVPLKNGTIQHGTYTIAVSLSPMRRPALSDKYLRFSLGPAISGLAKPITFYLDSVRTTKSLAKR